MNNRNLTFGWLILALTLISGGCGNGGSGSDPQCYDDGERSVALDLSADTQAFGCPFPSLNGFPLNIDITASSKGLAVGSSFNKPNQTIYAGKPTVLIPKDGPFLVEVVIQSKNPLSSNCNTCFTSCSNAHNAVWKGSKAMDSTSGSVPVIITFHRCVC